MNKNGSLWAPLGAIIMSALGLILWAKPVPHSGLQEIRPSASSFPRLPGQTSTLLPDGEVLLLGGQGAERAVAAAGIEGPSGGTAAPLAARMLSARAWQTATLLPDGTVLIFGGIGADGHLVKTAELFHPATKQFTNLPPLGVTPRAHHTATLLTEGTVFFAGGVDDDDQALGSAQIWDPRTNSASSVPSGLLVPRSDQTATLQADGTVLLWGGKDQSGSPLSYGEVYDPAAQSFVTEGARPPAAEGPVEIAATIPEDGSEDVPSNVLIAVRFSLPVVVQSASANTITLTGPDGNLTARVVPAEAGMLAFITPKEGLAPETTYTVEINGVSAANGSSISEFSFAFTTGSQSVSSGSLPISANWSGGPQNSPYLRLPPLEAPPGVTAISGQVLLQGGLPLKSVNLRVGTDRTQTDGTGRFLLRDVPSGHQVLVIDGRTASTKKATYGVFEVGVGVAGGQTNVLGYTIWMPVIDTAHAVTIPVPTTQETVITTPLIPGLELHLPAATTITDIDGKVVNQVSVTPIPVSQPPFPLPTGVKVPTYFTIQPGGGWIGVNNSDGPQGGWLVYPNAEHEPPGTRFNFWNYEPDDEGWYVYGQGSVTPGGNSVVPDPGVVIYEFTGAMVANPSLAPSKGPCNCSEEGGDPVDMGTGLFVYRSVDLYEPDVIPIVLTRTYRQGDGATRDFGIGAQNPYDIYLVGDYNTFSYLDLILPDGSQIYYNRISPGTSLITAVFQAQSSGGPFFGSTIQPVAGYWRLTRRDGTIYTFPSITNPPTYHWVGLLAITDRNGNTVNINKDSNYNITQITSPNGRWIQFTYDSSNRVTQAQDQLGRTVSYTYDSSGRLSQVTDANSGLWQYAYDSNNNMSGITDARGIAYLQNQYDSSGRVSLQTHADGGTYHFAYTTNQSGNITETDVTDPNGNLRKVTFNPPPTYPDGFITGGAPASITYAAGTPQSQTFTRRYQTGTDLLSSVTDPLSRVTSYTYDSSGNTTSVTRLAGTPSAVTTSFTYNPTFSQLTSVTDPLGRTTTFSYDSHGNLTSITDPLGDYSTFTNDSEGRVLTGTDPANETTSFFYTGADLTSTTGPLQRTTNFTYDSAGRLASATSPMGHVSQYSYNAFDQIASITDPLGGITSFTYDGDRNLLSVTDPKNQQNPTSYAYDSMDRLQRRTDPLGNPESYVYDENGNLIQFSDRRGTITTYTYDALNRLTFIGFGTQAGPTYQSTISYNYDVGDRLTQAVDSLAGSFARTWDGLDRVTQEQGPQETVSYVYDALGRRTQMTASGQPNAVTYAYDSTGRLTGISQGTTNVSFGYDSANRCTSLTLPNGIVVSYSYDAGSELTGINYQLAGTSLGNLTYAYDSDGRRVQTSGSWARTGMPNPTTSTQVYNVANQLTSWNGATLAYDLNGNLATDGINNYTWDARNQLTSITAVNGGTTIASFQYDPFGRRIQNTLGNQLLYDGANALQEISGGAPVANRLTGGVDEFFGRADSTGAFYPLADALGSTIALTDSAGTIQTQYTYEPFGNTTVAGAASSDTFQYTGRENDGTGLYFYRARYYSPVYQRFVSEDPVGFKGGTNLYAYVANSPTGLVDPTGEYARLNPDSRCAKVFAQALKTGLCGDEFAEDFNQVASKLPIYTIRSPQSRAAGLTQNTVSGDRVSATLGSTFFDQLIPPDAFTITDGNQPVIVLGPGYFERAYADRVADLIHEEFHAETGLHDSDIFNLFARYGLPSEQFRRWPYPTDEFSQWIRKGCPK